MRPVLSLAIVAFSAVTTLQASTIEYVGHRIVGTGTADVSITTDGTIGALSAGNIVDWVITVKNGGDSYMLKGPLSGGNSMIDPVGTRVGLSASATNLTFTFAYDPNGNTYALFQRGFPGSGQSFYCLGCGDGQSEKLLAAANAGEGDIATASRSGLQVIASVNATFLPIANFTWSPSSPGTGQTVQFTDSSTGSPTSWAWTFGDGTSSSSRNPSHTYTAAGSYSVTLTASNSAGSHSKTRTVTVAAAPVAGFEWSPASPGAGQEVQFTDTSTGSPTSRSWSFGDGGTSSTRNPKHTFVTAGTYDVTLTVANAAGSNRAEHAVTVAGGLCPKVEWSDLTLPTSAMGKELEELRGDVPENHPTLRPPLIDATLDTRVGNLESDIHASAPATRFTRESGLRPPDYQAHLFRIRTLFEAMYKVKGTNTAVLCAAEITAVDAERVMHGLKPRKPDGIEMPGTLAVNEHSNHEYGTALDVSVSPKPATWRALLTQNRLLEPCQEAAIHLQIKETPACGAAATITAAAFVPTGTGQVSVTAVPLVPIRILVRDPAGRRIGYDGASGTEINEIGETASYSGIDSDPQIVTVEDATDGNYQVEAVAVASGPYNLVISADDAEHDATITSRSTTGNAVTGNPIEPLALDVQTTVSAPGRRRSVHH